MYGRTFWKSISVFDVITHNCFFEIKQYKLTIYILKFIFNVFVWVCAYMLKIFALIKFC